MAISSREAARPGSSPPAPPAAQAGEKAQARMASVRTAVFLVMAGNVPVYIGIFKAPSHFPLFILANSSALTNSLTLAPDLLMNPALLRARSPGEILSQS